MPRRTACDEVPDRDRRRRARRARAARRGRACRGGLVQGTAGGPRGRAPWSDHAARGVVRAPARGGGVAGSRRRARRGGRRRGLGARRRRAAMTRARHQAPKADVPTRPSSSRIRDREADALRLARIDVGSVGGWSFASIAVSGPADREDREADAIADETMRTPGGIQSGLPGVRLHAGSAAARAAGAVGARAFALGEDIVFGPGEFAPDTDRGRHLLAHELAHVAQGRAGAGRAIRRRPAELIDNFVFLGQTVTGGINATLRDRLVSVQDRLQQVYDALGPNHPDRVHFGGGQKTLGQWAGVNSIRGWRQGSSTSKHASGSAVDINYDLQPYIATRTQVGT